MEHFILNQLIIKRDNILTLFGNVPLEAGKRCKSEKNSIGIKVIFMILTVFLSCFWDCRSFVYCAALLGRGRRGHTFCLSERVSAEEIWTGTWQQFSDRSACRRACNDCRIHSCLYLLLYKFAETLQKYHTSGGDAADVSSTITYGFAIIYSFGHQGLITKTLGHTLPFELYGIFGLLVGYSVYTIPVAFLLVSNTMQYIDKRS